MGLGQRNVNYEKGAIEPFPMNVHSRENLSSLIHVVESRHGPWQVISLILRSLVIASKPVTKLQILHVTLHFWFEKKPLPKTRNWTESFEG